MINIEAVKSHVAGHALVRGVEALPKGHIRIETAFLYPEGSYVDLFLQDEGLLPASRLSDLGQTYEWLLDVQVRPWLSKKRQAIVDDVLLVSGASQNGGALEIALSSLDELVPGVVRLGQTCVRVADLLFTRRSSLQAPATEEVEEVLADAELKYEANAELEGRFGNKVRVDFLVAGRRTRSALMTLSTQNGSQAHVQANEIFRRWYDLDIPARSEQRVTIFDDRYDTYREEDLRRLRDKSQVIALSERTSICDLLAS